MTEEEKKEIKYLENLKRKLDDQQLEACCAPGNVIVSAGAGSGKTQVLATRFAWLVMTKKIPAEKILTLTFTKKAASEMYQRIYGTLETLAAHPDTPEKEKELALKALKDFSKTHIQTLDSYNGAILKQCASRYGIRPDFSQGNCDVSGLAFSYVMENRTHPVVKRLINERNFGDLQKIASQINGEVMGRSSLASEKNNFENICKRKKIGCQNEWTKNFKKLKEKLNEFLEISEGVSNPSSSVETSIKEIKSLRTFIQNMPEKGDELTVEAMDDFKKFMEVFPWTLPNMRNATGDALKEIVYELRHTTKNPGEVVPKLLACIDYFEAYDEEVEYAKFLDAYMVQVNNRKRVEGLLSFSDVSAMALKALEEQDDLRIQEQKAYDKIMIDEFQDNNDMNRKLLFLLSSENEATKEECEEGSRLLDDKLFFVGDDKQSIYKFRGADVSVFKALGDYLHTKPINMVYNYRSTKEMLNSFNQIFGGFLPDGSKIPGTDNADFVFPEDVTNDMRYAATLKREQMAKRNEKLENVEPDFVNSPVHFCLFDRNSLSEDGEYTKKLVAAYENELREMGKETDSKSVLDYALVSNEDQKCYFIAKEIRNRIDSSNRTLSYKDFAILDRSRTDRSLLAKYLSYFEIPYNMDQESDISKSCVVNDIYNLLRLCVYPKDKIALASFLCSPFAGLNENDIEALFINNDFDFSKTDEISLSNLKKMLSEEKYNLYLKAQIFFEDIKAKVGSQALTKTITSLWYEYGYRYETMWHKDFYLDENLYDLLFELARQSDQAGYSLSYFIDTMESLNAKDLDFENLDYPKEVTDVVQVMTIHKSKGLEFPYVFVYRCDSRPQGDNDEKDENVTENSPFGIPKQIENSMADAEFRRVFYVALTRAEKECYIVSSKNDKNGQCLLMKLCRHYYPEMDGKDFSFGNWTYKENAPFDFISIKPEGRDVMNQGRHEVEKATLETKVKYIENKQKLYEKAQVVTFDSQLERNPLVSPSNLEKEKDKIKETVEPNSPVCPGLNELIAILKKSDFHENHFGTFAHTYLECFIKSMKKSRESGKKEKIELPASIFRKLWDYEKTEEENFIAEPVASLLQVCQTMCAAFMNSPFGKDLSNAEKLESEYAFMSHINNSVINGSIDLCYKMADGRVVVVDYKTDGEIHPDKYYAQLACYKDAVSELFDVDKSKISCFLYYLRYDQAVDATNQASEDLIP